MAKVEFTIKAKNIVPVFSGDADQININDISLSAENASTIGSLIRTDKEATLTVIIKD